MQPILFVHSYYRSGYPSGENESFEAEMAMLRARGHRVNSYVRQNDEIATYSKIEKVKFALQAIWSFRTRLDLKREIRDRPAIAHFHNTFPLISPGAYGACQAAGIPVVQTLRNYRFICPGAFLIRNGELCRDCLGKTVPWPAVRYRCYHGSRAESVVVSAMDTVHNVAGTWRKMVDLFVTPSAFARRMLVEGGFPADRVVVKPDPIFPEPRPSREHRDCVFFAGRLSGEKGVATLLEVARLLPQVKFRIAGDGPDAPELHRTASRLPNVEFIGALPLAQVLEHAAAARCMVVPSLFPETFARTVVEGFGAGVPVVASNVGAIPELIEEGRTGFMCTPQRPEQFAAAIDRLWSNPSLALEMGREARAEYERRLDLEHNFQSLLDVYSAAAAGAAATGQAVAEARARLARLAQNDPR